MSADLHAALNDYYELLGDPTTRMGKLAHEYHRRHETESACILTVTDDEKADAIAEYLRPRIEGKTIVEIGGGIGLLGCHLALIARRVYVVDADPAWTHCFLRLIYEKKPPNLTYIFGRAQDAPHIAADVALFCTHSGHTAMWQAASRFSSTVIDVYAEIGFRGVG